MWWLQLLWFATGPLTWYHGRRWHCSLRRHAPVTVSRLEWMCAMHRRAWGILAHVWLLLLTGGGVHDRLAVCFRVRPAH